MNPEGPMPVDEPTPKVERRGFGLQYSNQINAGHLSIVLTLISGLVLIVTSFDSVKHGLSLETSERVAAINLESTERGAETRQLRTEYAAATDRLNASIAGLIASQADMKSTLNELAKQVQTIGEASGRVRK